jgi:hypothetical protein
MILYAICKYYTEKLNYIFIFHKLQRYEVWKYYASPFHHFRMPYTNTH